MFLSYFQIRNIILCLPTYLRFTLVYDYFIFISYGFNTLFNLLLDSWVSSLGDVFVV